VLDIDRKNNKDGLKNFYEMFNRELLPTYLQDIENSSYPFFMKTPSNGFHLYFKYNGKAKNGIICEGVEVKTHQSAAGYKDKKPYILHGNIEDVKDLLGKIIDEIRPVQTTQSTTRDIKKNINYSTSREKPPYDKIKKWVREDRPREIAVGRNQEAFYTAIKCKQHHYTEAEALSCLMKDNDVNTLTRTELENIVKSAYRYQE
jgi:hypothetical protein